MTMADTKKVKESKKTQAPESSVKKPIKYNREARRKMNKNVNHNVFTKKYKDKKSIEKAWEIFLGENVFAEMKKQMRKAKKMNKERIENEKQMKSCGVNLEKLKEKNNGINVK